MGTPEHDLLRYNEEMSEWTRFIEEYYIPLLESQGKTDDEIEIALNDFKKLDKEYAYWKFERPEEEAELYNEYDE